MTKLLIVFLSLFFMQCKGDDNTVKEPFKDKKAKQDLLVEKYVTNCAKKIQL